MIDFSTLQGLTIPEGNVVSIMRKSDSIVFWQKVMSRLPSEYQEVEYIHIPTTAYINTNWTPSNNSLFNIKLRTSGSQYIFGTGSGVRLAVAFNETGISQFYNTSNETKGIYNFNTLGSGIVDIETFTSSGNAESYVMVNGEKKINQGTQSISFDQNLKMLLGAWQYNASTIRQGDIILYYAKASVAGVDIFEMIPCYRKADGVIGMYDLVSKTLFTNAGTGDFRSGPDVGGPMVNLLPSALTPDDLDSVFDGRGYKNGYYASAAEPFYNIDAAFFCSGLIPIPKSQTFYVKGCTMDTSLSHTRFGLMQQTGGTINTAVLANWNGDISVETLGTQYYEITINRLIYSVGTAYYFYFSASGTGENVIVSATRITT